MDYIITYKSFTVYDKHNLYAAKMIKFNAY